jgi:hypothetical protein
MPFEARISELSDKLASCKDESEALMFAQELQAALHERIDQLRTQTSGMALLDKQKNSDS